MLIDFDGAAEREFRFQRLVPVEGLVPAALIDGRPAVRQPEFGILIAAGCDELAKLAVGNKPVADLVSMQQRIVARRLVVETETLAGRTDTHNAGFAGRERVAAW